jgi:hypothetical protein
VKNTINVGVQLQLADGDLLPWEVFALTRVPCIGEHVGHVQGEGQPEGPFRVVRVTHFFQAGDGGRVAEICAVKETNER